MFIRRSQSIAAFLLLSPFALDGASNPVWGQSSPSFRADQRDAERRAIALVTYDGGEVTVGELEAAVAASSLLAQQRADEPAALRALLDRLVQFELMAREAERRGYGDHPRVLEAIRQNAVHRLLQQEVDAPLAEGGESYPPRPSVERDAKIESLIAEQRKARVREVHPELVELVDLELTPEDLAAQ